MFQLSKEVYLHSVGFDNLMLVLTIKDASDLLIYLYIHFSQSGQDN